MSKSLDKDKSYNLKKIIKRPYKYQSLNDQDIVIEILL